MLAAVVEICHLCLWRLEGAEEQKVFGFCKRAKHPDEEQASDSRAATTVRPFDLLSECPVKIHRCNC